MNIEPKTESLPMSPFTRFPKIMSILSALVVACVFLVAVNQMAGAATISANDAKVVREISKHFSGVPSMTGEFIQFGPNGEQTGGKFYLQRPGKIRFDYNKPSPLTVKSNGRTVSINNRKLKTFDYIPLRKTPLRLLLADKIDVNDKAIKSIKQEDDLTTVVLADKSVFGNSRITLMFDPESYDLRQWTITDNQGKDTSVMIFNVKKNVKFRSRLFRVDQLADSRRNRQDR